MSRNDRYGDRGPKGDRADVENTYATQVGSTMRLHRLDGSTADYRYTPAGWRMIPGSDTKANAKAEVERDLANLRAQPVKVHLTQGCGLCGRTDEHTHGRRAWEAFIAPDAAPAANLPPAAEPYSPPKRTTPPTPPRPSAAPTNGSAGGTGMSGGSIEEVRAGIAASNEHSTSALGALQQAHADLEQAQATLLRAVEGSGQADASEATGLLAQAVGSVEEVRQQVSAAISASESVGNRL